MPREALAEALAKTHQLELARARELLQRARAAAEDDPHARSISQWFEIFVEREARAARSGRAPQTVPGRRTLLATDASADEIGDDSGRRAPAPGSQRLDILTQWRMSQVFGFDFSGVSIRRDSPEATGTTRALVKNGEIHFREGAYQPGTRAGDWLLAHELAHVVQQRQGTGESPASRTAIEREADRAASLAVRGQAAPIALRAQPAAVYAFSDDEDHDAAPAEDVGGGAVEAPEAEASEPAEAPEPAAAPEPAEVPEAAEADDAQGGEAEDGAVDDSYDPRSELAMAPIPAEGGDGGGAPGGGGGAQPKPQKEAPNVAAAPPEAGFTQLQGVRPDKLVPSLGQVHTAAKTDVGKKRAEAKANPPKQMSNGDGAAAKGKGGGEAGAPGAGGKKPAPGSAEKAEKTVKGEVPGGEAAKQQQQGAAQQQQKTAGAPIMEAARQVASWLAAFNGKPASGTGANGANGSGANGGQPTMSDAEVKQMSGSLSAIPTNASDISTDPGPAPELAMKGEAKSDADRDRAKLETQTAQLQAQGQTDSRVPLGEDHIETSVPTEELAAKAAAAAPEVALPTVADAAPSEEVAIVAQEQNGAQIDAALAKASADVATERGKHAQEDQKARADADTQIHDLKTKADADQTAARTAAKAESDKARGEWQTEIDKKGADARKQADKKVAEGMAQVEAEEQKANDEAKRHIDEGKQKADDERKKGEDEAKQAKEKGEEKSSGFFGWLSSKAKAFFDGIKKAISAAIDACKKAVKAVIDAAKKLAMAAIELARKAIVAAIKAIGDALIAITDVLLAAFPELKAKFQAAIKKAVDKAVDTVNKLAEGLKKAVQAALDLLGKAIDAALGLLEKGLHAIVDMAASVVQGYIDAAKAIVDALGEWVKIIKDVAKGPGAWIGKLGAAVVDGIKNHLWSAFKTAVVEWFKSKLIEVLGVAGIILEILLQGGITMDDIVKMAMDALIVAIPMALVAILIEKLVAMIVPAAGALMAIIEGLQAAWGTISRIIAAFSAFMAFLSAVQGGGAGPLFATALASAAVVVLDFVANWLLKKLRGPASKVGKKLEGIADKLKLKKKGKGKPGGGKGKGKRKEGDADGPDGAVPKKRKDDPKDDKARKKQEEKDRKNQEILAKAQRELPPKIHAALQKKPGKLMFRARLTAWRVQYRLTSLQMIEQGDRFKLKATVNPSAELDGGFVVDVLAMLKRIGDRLMRENPEALQRAAERAEGMGIDPSEAKAQRAYAPETAEERLAVAAHQKAQQPNREQRDRTLVHHGTVEEGGHVRSVHEKPGGRGQRVQGDEVVRPVNSDGSASNATSYADLAKKLEDRGVTPKKLAEAMRSMSTGLGVPASMKGHEKELGELMGLMFGTEASRDSRNPLFSMMAIEQMERGAAISTTLTQTPAEMQGHVRAAEGNRTDLEGGERTKRHRQAKIDELIQRQMAQLEAWFMTKSGGRELTAVSVAELEKHVEDMVRRFIRTRIH